MCDLCKGLHPTRPTFIHGSFFGLFCLACHIWFRDIIFPMKES